MDLKNIAVAVLFGMTAGLVVAQTTTPSAPPVPAAPATAPAPAAPAASSQPTVAEGALFKSQRMRNDKGTYNFICTYRIAGTKRDVLLDESCPESMVFQLKK